MRNRCAARGDVLAIEARSVDQEQRVIALDLADRQIAEDEAGWKVSRPGQAISTRGRLLHRLILGVTSRKLVVVPINGRWLDCRRRNLRVITRSELSQSIVPIPSTGVRFVRYDISQPNKPFLVVLKDGWKQYGHHWATLREATKEARSLAQQLGRQFPAA